MPPGHDHQEACAIAEPSEEVVREPVPNLVANRLAHRLRSALDWIVDDADVQALTGDLALDGGVAKRAAMVHVLQHVGVSMPARSAVAEAGSKDVYVALACHDALKFRVHTYPELVAVARVYRLQVRSFSSKPGDEVRDLL